MRMETKERLVRLGKKASKEEKGPWDLLVPSVSGDLQATKELLDLLVTKALEVKWADKELKERMDHLA